MHCCPSSEACPREIGPRHRLSQCESWHILHHRAALRLNNVLCLLAGQFREARDFIVFTHLRGKTSKTLASNGRDSTSAFVTHALSPGCIRQCSSQSVSYLQYHCSPIRRSRQETRGTKSASKTMQQLLGSLTQARSYPELEIVTTYTRPRISHRSVVIS